MLQLVQILDHKVILFGKQIERRNTRHIRCRGNDSLTAQIGGKAPGSGIGAAQVSGQQTDYIFSLLVENQHCRVRCFRLHQRCNLPHGNARCHNEYQQVTGYKITLHCRIERSLGFYCAAKCFLQPQRQLFSLGRQPEICRFHAFFPCRYSWVNALSYSLDNA